LRRLVYRIVTNVCRRFLTSRQSLLAKEKFMTDAQATAQTGVLSTKRTWTGRILTGLSGAFFILDAS
jgi:hypothetical protein